MPEEFKAQQSPVILGFYTAALTLVALSALKESSVFIVEFAFCINMR